MNDQVFIIRDMNSVYILEDILNNIRPLSAKLYRINDELCILCDQHLVVRIPRELPIDIVSKTLLIISEGIV